MSQNNIPVCFHRRSTMDNPFSALEEAVAVAQMLNCFLALTDDLQTFQDTETSQPVFGLGIVIDAIGDTVDQAAKVIAAELRELRAEKARHEAAAPVAVQQPAARRTWGHPFLDDVREAPADYHPDEEGPLTAAEPSEAATPAPAAPSADEPGLCAPAVPEGTYPKVSPALTARDAAIAATAAQGYEIEEIAQAVNLKKQTVERIIARLRGEGTVPKDGEAGGLDQAAGS